MWRIWRPAFGWQNLCPVILADLFVDYRGTLARRQPTRLRASGRQSAATMMPNLHARAKLHGLQRVAVGVDRNPDTTAPSPSQTDDGATGSSNPH